MLRAAGPAADRCLWVFRNVDMKELKYWNSSVGNCILIRNNSHQQNLFPASKFPLKILSSSPPVCPTLTLVLPHRDPLILSLQMGWTISAISELHTENLASVDLEGPKDSDPTPSSLPSCQGLFGACGLLGPSGWDPLLTIAETTKPCFLCLLLGKREVNSVADSFKWKLSIPTERRMQKLNSLKNVFFVVVVHKK